MPSDTIQKSRFTIFEAVKQISWPIWFITIFIGGPSILTVFKFVFPEYEFSQVIRDALKNFEDVIRVVNISLGPFAESYISAINRFFGSEIKLQNYWSSLSLTNVALIAAFLRATVVIGADRQIFFDAISGCIGVFFASFYIACIPESSTWWQQGLYCALILFYIRFFVVVRIFIVLALLILFISWTFSAIFPITEYIFEVIVVLIVATKFSLFFAFLLFVFDDTFVIFIIGLIVGVIVEFLTGLGGRSTPIVFGLIFMIFSYAFIVDGLYYNNIEKIKAGLVGIGGFISAFILFSIDLSISLFIDF